MDKKNLIIKLFKSLRGEKLEGKAIIGVIIIHKFRIKHLAPKLIHYCFFSSSLNPKHSILLTGINFISLLSLASGQQSIVNIKQQSFAILKSNFPSNNIYPNIIFDYSVAIFLRVNIGYVISLIFFIIVKFHAVMLLMIYFYNYNLLLC